MSKQSFGTLFGDILTEWLLRHVEDVFYPIILTNQTRKKHEKVKIKFILLTYDNRRKEEQRIT